MLKTFHEVYCTANVDLNFPSILHGTIKRCLKFSNIFADSSPKSKLPKHLLFVNKNVTKIFLDIFYQIFKGLKKLYVFLGPLPFPFLTRSWTNCSKFFFQLAHRSSLISVNCSFALEIKVHSRAMSEWAIWKSDVPCSDYQHFAASASLLPARLQQCDTTGWLSGTPGKNI